MAAEQQQTQQQEPDSYDKMKKEITQKGLFQFEYAEGDKEGQKLTKTRKKISVRKMNELEDMRAQYGSLIANMNTRNTDKSLSLDERRKAANLLTDIYAKCTLYYFGIEREEFETLDWDSMKINVDVATDISIFGRPNLA